VVWKSALLPTIAFNSVRRARRSDTLSRTTVVAPTSRLLSGGGGWGGWALGWFRGFYGDCRVDEQAGDA